MVHRYNPDGSEQQSNWRLRWAVHYATNDCPYGRDDDGLQRWIDEHIDAAFSNDVQPLFPLKSPSAGQPEQASASLVNHMHAEEFAALALERWTRDDLPGAFAALLAAHTALLDTLTPLLDRLSGPSEANTETS